MKYFSLTKELIKIEPTDRLGIVVKLCDVELCEALLDKSSLLQMEEAIKMSKCRQDFLNKLIVVGRFGTLIEDKVYVGHLYTDWGKGAYFTKEEIFFFD